MKIINIKENGYAHKVGLKAGDELLSINNNPIRDHIDFEFWSHENEMILKVRRGHSIFEISVDHARERPFGAEFEEMKTLCCGNDCVFCFVDQNPTGLRKTLYVKDEDYRLSFLYGNYVTLTNVNQKRLDRIIQQRLSPLYISVHAIDPIVRKKMLGLKRNDKILDKLSFLAENRIEMHVQIVLCPGWNDGIILDETVDRLSLYYPWIKTLAIVPVGLTRHRKHLVDLDPVDMSFAKEIIEWHRKKITRISLDTHFVFLADEFYLKAGVPLPDAGFYEDFNQIENGVGMTRDFIDTFMAEKDQYPLSVPGYRLTIVTGKLAEPIIRRYVLPTLDRIQGLHVQLVPVENEFYGEQITVSGLLVGEDIFKQLSKRKLGDMVVLPPNCINDDGLFLDNWRPKHLQLKLNTTIVRPNYGFDEVFRMIKVSTRSQP